MRVLAEGACGFLTSSKNWAWNMFDLLVVISDIATIIVAAVNRGESRLNNVTVLRLLRVLRVIRAVRVLRLVRFCRDLRMMVYSILRSGSTILWSMFLLLMVVLMFGICITQSVVSALVSQELDGDITYDLQRFFGDLIWQSTHSSWRFPAASRGSRW